MFKSITISIGVLAIAFAATSCKPAEKVPEKLSPFAGDAPFQTTRRTVITEEKLPIPGKTQESELDKLFPEGYVSRLTFVYDRLRGFEKKEIKFNRVYFYMDSDSLEGVQELDDTKMDRKYLAIFVLDGIVQDYALAHYIHNSASADKRKGWKLGPLSNYNAFNFPEDWPGAQRDYLDYFTQPGDHIQRSEKAIKFRLGNADRVSPATTKIIRKLIRNQGAD